MKELEKARILHEEREEEERVRKERERMKMEFNAEQDKKKRDKDMVDMENRRIMDQHLLITNKQRTGEANKVQFQVHTANTNDIVQTTEINKETITKLFNNEEDTNLRISLNNELMKLRQNITEQQNQLLGQINDLKTETQNANLQRYEALKEISHLKEELAKQRADEELRQKYVYDVMVDNSNNVNKVYSHTKLPAVNDEYTLELPKNHTKNLKSLYYDDSIKHPNRVPKVPNLDELKENEFKVSSKFIDIDTYNVVEVFIY
jgi:hypothetical protein